MANWTDKYRQLISSSHKLHTIVADKDNLFAYVELQQAIRDAGYSIITAKTDLEVRIRFELEVRNSPEKYVIVAPPTYNPLPDIAINVHFQSIGLKHLFPHLDAKAIEGLSFNALCLLSNIKPYEELGREKTVKFLLENLYNVDFDTLTTSKPRERILNALINVFLEKNGINQPLTAFLSGIAQPYFPGLIETGMSRTSLIHYLQDKWSSYVSSGNCDIDFQDSILNKSFGYLFIFDHLNPVKVSDEKLQEIPGALRIGVFTDDKESNDSELEALVQYLEQQQCSIEDLYVQWFNLIQILAKAKVKELHSANQSLKQQLRQTIQTLNQRFQRFIDNAYPSLFSLSGVRKPVVVSRILEHIKAQPEQRKALLVIDGMNYWQWLLIAKALHGAGIVCNAGTTLAFIPSITAWSRQAVFKGGKPNMTEDNTKEPALFKAFWQSSGFSDNQIDFVRLGHNQPFYAESIPETVKILGLVCNDLDDIMHGSILGNEQLMTSTEQWILQSKITETVASLRLHGFKVYITTDHGNLEATGIKNLRLKEKTGSLSRSKRYIHFSNETMLANFREQNPDLTIGTRDNAVYLRHEEAFTDENRKIITHGGSHLWEALIPFIEIL